MTRPSTFVAALLLVTTAALAAPPRIPEIAALADGCAVTPLAENPCGSVTRGRLINGDCTTTDGRNIDYYEFGGVEGVVVAATLRPLDSTLTNPSLVLFPPAGDPAHAPGLFGGRHAELWYELTSNGTWRVGVTSEDRFASGDYALHFDCYTDEQPARGAGCTAQYLTCGQTGAWYLDNSGCRFPGTADPYNVWWIWGAAGDTLQLQMTADGFTPVMAISPEGGAVVQTSTPAGANSATLTYTFFSSGYYRIIAYATESRATGFYFITTSCNTSGCVFPYIDPFGAVTVPARGASATLNPTIRSYGGGPLTLQLLEAAKVIATSTTGSIATPAIDGPRRFQLRVINECGAWTTEPFTVQPREAAKRRAVRP
ncbi:MAG TPA: hypothetical protein VND45_00650 [Thermoanaerobaculia bacterium]|jgi:hypothetical protein|nr:hypothetical protein [Thermoanaerobaculia bacterium]